MCSHTLGCPQKSCPILFQSFMTHTHPLQSAGNVMSIIIVRSDPHAAQGPVSTSSVSPDFRFWCPLPIGHIVQTCGAPGVWLLCTFHGICRQRELWWGQNPQGAAPSLLVTANTQHPSPSPGQCKGPTHYCHLFWKPQAFDEVHSLQNLFSTIMLPISHPVVTA